MDRYSKKTCKNRPLSDVEKRIQKRIYRNDLSDADRALESDSSRSLERLFDKTLAENIRNGFFDAKSHLLYINLAMNEKTSVDLKLRALSVIEEHFSTLLTPFKQEDFYYEAKDSLEWISLYSDNNEVCDKARDVLDLF